MKEYRHPPGTGHLFERKCERHKEGGWYNRVIGSFVSTFFFLNKGESCVFEAREKEKLVLESLFFNFKF